MYKDWPSKVEKMNRFIKEHNNKNPKRIKTFTQSEFLTAHAIIIGASCYCQMGPVLFNDKKD